MSNNPLRKKTANDDDEVEQLLRAAQDDMLLKLSINSHIASASTIESDLDRRFQALKKPGPHPPLTSASKMVNSLPDDQDPFARFAALKSQGKGKTKTNKSSSIGQLVNEKEEESSGTGNDEVDKLIKWAIDAARLDPSPLSDDNVSENDESDASDESDDDDEADGKLGRRRRRSK